MTLQEFADRSGTVISTTERGGTYVVVAFDDPGRKDAWHLDDYIMSSNCGIVLWFVPRNAG